jgi:hypothetical protein
VSGWCDINWGSVPEWLGGIGTAGALILGLIVLKRDAAARSEETRRRQATDDERRRMQASKVTGLITDDRIQVAELPLAQSPISVLTARAHNDSDQPNLPGCGPGQGRGHECERAHCDLRRCPTGRSSVLRRHL